MKTKLFILFIPFLFIAKSLGQNGTVFDEISFDQAIEKSIKENKYVFIDCYTSWCGPCKNMSKNIFPQKKAGSYFNPKFVNVAYDIEKEEDGIMLAKKYNIRSVPTFLIFKSDGTLLSTIVGGSVDVDAFIEKVEGGFENEKMYSSIKAIYDSNVSKKELLSKTLDNFESMSDSVKLEVVTQLVGQSTDKEKISPNYWFIYSSPRFSPKDSKNESFMFTHYDDFRKSVGREEVDKQLGERYRKIVKEIAEGKKSISAEELKNINTQINKLQLSKEYMLSQYISIGEAVISKDLDNLINVSETVLPELNITAYFMLTDRIQNEGTIEQNKRWIALGEKLKDVIPIDDNMAVWTSALIDHLKKKVKEKEDVL